MNSTFQKFGLGLLMAVTILASCQPDQNKSNQSTAEKRQDVPAPVKVKEAADMNYTELSQALLTAVKDRMPYASYANRLAAASKESLKAELDTDNERLAFWVNVYNAYIQIALRKDSNLYDDRGDFFKLDQVPIAGENLSFDKIEHGIIRSSTMKLSRGYVGKFFPGAFEKEFRVVNKDPRIHFVLNCGAKSCPEVYIYNPTTLDTDFDQVAKAYLRKVSRYDEAKNEVVTSRLFSWFLGDFDGKDGVREMLYQYGILPADKYKKTDIDYAEYDWTLDLNSFGAAKTM